MKQTLTKLSLTLALFVALIMPSLPAYAAGGASISLSASKSTIASGGTVIIAVYVNGGGNAVNAVQADLTYPASKLQYVGFSGNGSAFEIGASSGGGDGLATLARGTISSVSGSGLLGTVTFRALVGSGSAAIGVAGSSSVVSDGNPVGYGSSGTSVNFGAVAASTSGAPTHAAAPAPPKDTSPPIITTVKVTGLTPFTATITWTTSKPSDSTVEFGLDAKYGLSSSLATLSTAHAVVLNSSFLTPQTLLHYHVKSTDGSGNVGTSPDLSFELPGVPITIIVRGADGRPQAGASVTLDNATGTTDAKGTVTLRSGLGNKKLTTTYQGVTIQKPISVTRSAKPLPPIQLDLAKKPLNPWMLTSLGLLVVTLTLLAIDAMLFGSRILARITGLHFLQPLHHPRPAAAAPVAKLAVESAAHAPEKTISEPPVKTEPEVVEIEEPNEAAIVDDGKPLDPTSTVAQLMGDETPETDKLSSPPPPVARPAEVTKEASAKPLVINHSGETRGTAPLVISLEPVGNEAETTHTTAKPHGKSHAANSQSRKSSTTIKVL